MNAMCISVVSSMPFESCQRKKISIPAKISTPQNQKYELFKLKQDIYTYKQGKARQLQDRRSDLYQTLCHIKYMPIPTIMPSSITIPTVDLSSFVDGGDESSRQKAKDTISDACINLGVFQIENHGVSLDQMDQLMKLSKTFFSYSDEEKAKSTEPDKSKTRAGYTKRPIDAYDDFEYLLMLPPGKPFNGVPNNPPDCRKTFEDVFKYFLKTAQILEEIINDCLGLPPNFLKRYINNDRSSDYMVVMNYPPATETDNTGIAEHEDPNIFTIILEDDVEGLEVCIDGKWSSVTPSKGKLVVVLGDLIQVWSNKKYRSLTHGAVRHKGTTRTAVDFVYTLKEEKWVTPLIGHSPKYREFLYKDYMDLKLKDEENPPSRREDAIRITHYEI